MTLVYAHRGASGDFPENTLLAFREALQQGVDGIELDLHATADGAPVVIHDREVERTTTGMGYVDELSFAQLRTLDAGNGERVPTFGEVLELVGDSVHLDLEIKGLGIEIAVLRTLAEFPAARWAISSFDWHTLRRIRKVAPAAELWPLADAWRDDVAAVAAELGSPVVALSTSALTTQSAAALAGAGLRAMVWTVNDVSEAMRVRDLDAFSLCTDVPDRILAAFREH
jgi:glycerophosphoryl diester phosphodiesterase